MIKRLLYVSVPLCVLAVVIVILSANRSREPREFRDPRLAVLRQSTGTVSTRRHKDGGVLLTTQEVRIVAVARRHLDEAGKLYGQLIDAPTQIGDTWIVRFRAGHHVVKVTMRGDGMISHEGGR